MPCQSTALDSVYPVPEGKEAGRGREGGVQVSEQVETDKAIAKEFSMMVRYQHKSHY